MIIGTIALIAILMHGAGANSWPMLANKEIEHVIEDKARREKATAILDRMQVAMASHLDSVVACRKELVAVELSLVFQRFLKVSVVDGYRGLRGQRLREVKIGWGEAFAVGPVR